jgi:hypothetical protein
VHATADPDQLSVVVLAGQLRRLDAEGGVVVDGLVTRRGTQTQLWLDPLSWPSILVYFAGAVHISTRVARGHALAARALVAADRLGVPSNIHRRVRLTALEAGRPHVVVTPGGVVHQARTTIAPAKISITTPPSKSVRMGILFAASFPSVSPTRDMTRVTLPATTATVTAE